MTQQYTIVYAILFCRRLPDMMKLAALRHRPPAYNALTAITLIYCSIECSQGLAFKPDILMFLQVTYIHLQIIHIITPM